MPRHSEFHQSLDKLDLSPVASGIFTYGVDALSLDDDEVGHFNEIARRINDAAPSFTADQLAGVARRVVRRAGSRKRSSFIESRLRHLSQIRTMAEDRNWTCEPQAARCIRELLTYVDSSHGLFNDQSPVIGRLDDALLADIAMGMLREELDQYREFCRYRREMAVGLGVEPDELALDRATWESERGDKERLQKQLRRVHESSYAGKPPEPPFRVS